MKITIADHYGMCFGVRDALAQAEKLAISGPLTILGELVHNPIVRERLARQGVREGRLDEGPEAPTNQVMITAHGASDRAREQWRAAGFAVADGACPLVKHAHNQLRALVAAGFLPVVIGQRGHVEVQGLIGDFPGACVIENLEDIGTLPESDRFGVISQTTQPLDHVTSLVEAIRAARPQAEVVFRDTVCRPTKDRQTALRRLIDAVEVVVVVGGQNSNNTRQLAQTARAAGRVAHHIERPEDLDPAWFRGVGHVGVTAGTSTLKETVAAVHKRLMEFAAA